MQERSERPVGLTRDTGWQIGVRRTVSLSHTAAWKLLTSPEGVRIWLGADSSVDWSKGATHTLADGTSGEIRIFEPGSHLRITWHPKGWPRASTIQVRVVPKADRCVIAFHQEHLPGPDEREERRSFFKKALDRIEPSVRGESAL